MDLLKESWVFLEPALSARANQAIVLDSGLPGNVSKDFPRIQNRIEPTRKHRSPKERENCR